MNFEVVEGFRRGTKNFVHDGQLYRKSYSKEPLLYLKCVDSSKGCKGTAKIENNVLTTLAEHSGHGPRDDLIYERKAKEVMRKTMSANATLGAKEAYEVAVRENAIDPTFDFKSFKSSLYRAKAANVHHDDKPSHPCLPPPAQQQIAGSSDTESVLAALQSIWSLKIYRNKVVEEQVPFHQKEEPS